MHERDEDCSVNQDNVCDECGAAHGEQCPHCLRRAFHLAGCPATTPGGEDAVKALEDVEAALRLRGFSMEEE
jgi:hypothetical protein